MNRDLIYCPDDFINNMEHIHLEKGDIIIRRNSCPNYVYVVISALIATACGTSSCVNNNNITSYIWQTRYSG